MKWHDHSDLEGQHAFLSPSKGYWLNYSEEKLRTVYENQMAVHYGERLHAFAAEAIKLKRRQPRGNDTLNMYINDAISYRMRPEQPLLYSKHCFGTCDAISYSEKKRLLRISDLKTGAVPAHMRQLEIYAAVFLLEYGIELGLHSPADLTIELRIYQSGEIIFESPEPECIQEIMTKIINSDTVLDEMSLEEFE